MTKKSLAFVRFLNLKSLLTSSRVGESVLHHDADELLCYIYEQNRAEKEVIMTHLVHQKIFGAPPTIQRRIKELLDSYYIETYNGHDKRLRCLRLTNAGVRYLEECSDLLCAASQSHG